jgi:AraC-like DNA-binding protein
MNVGGTFVQKPEVATVIAFRTTPSGRGDLIVVGPRTRGRYNPNKELPICVRVRLRPGRARAALGVPVHELADRAVPIGDLWGAEGRRLTATLTAAGDDTARVASLLGHAFPSGPDNGSLLGRAFPSGSGNGLVEAAMSELTRPEARLSDVAAVLGVSERHLRNLFAREVGLSPKHFARISRVRSVLAQAGRRPWAEVAIRAGFFDQAHMIDDFRSMMGVSPGAYLAGRLPAVTPCGYPGPTV